MFRSITVPGETCWGKETVGWLGCHHGHKASILEPDLSVRVYSLVLGLGDPGSSE